MAQVQGEEIYLSHSGQEVDDNIDEVVAARGSEVSLSARLSDIVSNFEADQQRQDDEISTKIALSDAFGLGTALTAGLDLNNLTGIGVYYAPSTTIAQSLLNCPASYTFRLEIKTTNGTNRYMQTIYEVSTANGQIAIYRRSYTVNGWQPWYRFSGEAVSAVQSAPASLMQAGRIGAELTAADPAAAEEADA